MFLRTSSLSGVVGVRWGGLSGEGVVWSKLLLKVLSDTHLKKSIITRSIGVPSPSAPGAFVPSELCGMLY